MTASEKGKDETVLEQVTITLEKQSLPIELRTRLSWFSVLAVLSLLSNLLPVSDLPGKAKFLLFLPML